MQRVFVLIALLGSLAGCASAEDGPSLLPRPVERLATAARTPEPAPIAAPLNMALAARVDAIVARGNRADAAFAVLANDLRAVIGQGRGAGVGSEPWIAAQNARSRLITARQTTSAALADLDILLTGERPTGAVTIAYVTAAQQRLEAIIARESAAITGS